MPDFRTVDCTDVPLSLEELALLPIDTGMMKNNLFAKRKKAQAMAAKRAKEAPVLKSPRTQMLENQERMKDFARGKKDRLEQARAGVQREVEERRKSDALAREDQRQAIERMEQSNGENSSFPPSPKRKLPSKRNLALPAALTRSRFN